MLKGKKIGGILSELVKTEEKGNSVIVGIGINQNINHSEMPPELRDYTTTIKSELGQDTSRERLIAMIINGIDSRFLIADSQSSLKFIIHEWVEVSSTIGRQIEAMVETGKIRGKAIGISDFGSLQISTDEGIIELSTGDIIHLREEKVVSK
jgi:BirA family biotin operon repressor/biotin-[acetyl-CoA-carboxylase] ligase